MSETSKPATQPTPSASFPPSDAEIIDQLKQQLHAAEHQLSTTEQRLQYAELKICVLEERLRLQRIAKYGPGSRASAMMKWQRRASGNRWRLRLQGAGIQGGRRCRRIFRG